MAGNVTNNQSPIIKAEVYSDFMLEQINDNFLADGLHRDVSDFATGDTLHIPVMGDTVLRDYVEDTGVKFDAIDTGEITLNITEYVSSASYVTDKLKQDAYKAAQLEAAIPGEHLRVINERYETDLLSQSSEQTLGASNDINKFAHRWVANNGGSTGLITLKDFLYAKLSLDKAYMPDEGRLCIVDPITEATLNELVGDQAFINNPMFEGIVNTGFAKGKRFIRNIYGFDIWVSNRLPRIESETISGGPHNSSASITDGVANIFGCFADDQHTPFMGAWRQMPQTEGFRNSTFKRDEYSTTARWGFGLQRPESLVTVITDADAFQ